MPGPHDCGTLHDTPHCNADGHKITASPDCRMHEASWNQVQRLRSEPKLCNAPERPRVRRPAAGHHPIPGGNPAHTTADFECNKEKFTWRETQSNVHMEAAGIAARCSAVAAPCISGCSDISTARAPGDQSSLCLPFDFSLFPLRCLSFLCFLRFFFSLWSLFAPERPLLRLRLRFCLFRLRLGLPLLVLLLLPSLKLSPRRLRVPSLQPPPAMSKPRSTAVLGTSRAARAPPASPGGIHPGRSGLRGIVSDAGSPPSGAGKYGPCSLSERGPTSPRPLTRRLLASHCSSSSSLWPPCPSAPLPPPPSEAPPPPPLLSLLAPLRPRGRRRCGDGAESARPRSPLGDCDRDCEPERRGLRSLRPSGEAPWRSSPLLLLLLLRPRLRLRDLSLLPPLLPRPCSLLLLLLLLLDPLLLAPPLLCPPCNDLLLLLSLLLLLLLLLASPLSSDRPPPALPGRALPHAAHICRSCTRLFVAATPRRVVERKRSFGLSRCGAFPQKAVGPSVAERSSRSCAWPIRSCARRLFTSGLMPAVPKPPPAPLPAPALPGLADIAKNAMLC